MNMFPMESAIDPSGDTDVMLYVILSLLGLCLENMAYTKCYQATMNWLQRRPGGTEKMSACPPNRLQGIVGMTWGGLFVLVGLFVLAPIFGGFGLVWALFAAVFTGLHAYQIFIKKHAGPKIRDRKAKGRLEQLESLRSAGLIDDREYQKKRQDILRGL